MSSQQWYFEDHGRAKGPISTMDLVKKIQQGDLNLLDLIFKEGDKQWNPLEHYTEVTDLIGNVTVRAESDWILLRTLEVDGQQCFEQIGPFNIDQVLEMVDKGKATFNDHVWRTGFDNWVSLGKVDKFQKPLPSSVAVDISLYKMPRHEILDKVPPIPVKAYNPVKKITQKEEAPPEDAAGPDLAQPTWMVEPKKAAAPLATKPIEKEKVAVKPVEKTVATPVEKVIAKPVEKIVATSVEKTAVRPIERTETKSAVSMIEKPIEKVIAKPVERLVEKPLELRRDPPTQTQTNARLTETRTENRTEMPTQTRPDLVTEIRATEARPIKISVKKSDPLAAPAARPNPASVDDDSTGEVIPLPSPEAVEKMRRRWGQVGHYLGYGFVAAGLVFVALWTLKNFHAAEEVAMEVPPQMKERPAVYQPDVLPPPAEDLPQELRAKNERPAVSAPQIPPPAPPMNKAPRAENLAKIVKPEVKNEVAKKEIPLEIKSSEELAKLSFKQKAVYHHAERKFIFYTSQRAIAVAMELNSLQRKRGKNGSGWKSGYSAWQTSLRNSMSGELKSSQQRLYPDMYNRLRKALVALDQRAKEFNSQLLSGRNPTKELTVDDLISELKKINAKAKALDE